MFTRHFPYWPPGQPRTLELPKVSVYANLSASAAKHPQRAAIDYYGTRLSYAELKRQVDALAGWLQRRYGVAHGDRVLLYAQNSPQFVIAYYAILRADAVVVPVNPMNRTEELRHYVEDSGAEVDMNVVMTGDGRLVEVQATAERVAFSRADLDALVDLAAAGIAEIGVRQREAVA